MVDAVIRPYRPGDRDQVYDVCLRTADSGGDATAIYQDQELIGDLFAGPYLLLAPDFAFVLDDGERVCRRSSASCGTCGYRSLVTGIRRRSGRPRTGTRKCPNSCTTRNA
jgi:hypothetical protein